MRSRGAHWKLHNWFYPDLHSICCCLSFPKCINCCKLSSICCINLNILLWQLSLITARIILNSIFFGTGAIPTPTRSQNPNFLCYMYINVHIINECLSYKFHPYSKLNQWPIRCKKGIWTSRMKASYLWNMYNDSLPLDSWNKNSIHFMLLLKMFCFITNSNHLFQANFHSSGSKETNLNHSNIRSYHNIIDVQIFQSSVLV